MDSRQGWIVVGATLVATFATFGVTYSFGTFFRAMAAEFGAGNGPTALLFGITIFAVFGLSLPAGRLADRYGPRPIVLAAAASIGLGLVLTSWVSQLWVGYLTYGVGVGTATACAYVPMVSQVSGWFERRRPLALGLAVSGIGLGTLVVPRVAAELIASEGWRTTFRLCAAVSAGLLLIAAVGARRSPTHASVAAVDLRRVMRSTIFRRLYAAGLLLGVALFVPFVFLPAYAEDHGSSPGSAALLLSLLGVGSLAGRLLLGALGGPLGVLRLYWLCFGVSAASFVIWLLARDSYATLAAFAAVLGVAYGGYVALAPAVAAQLFGLSGLGAVLGALYSASGVGGLAGPPLAGWLIDVTGTYVAAIVFALVVAIVAVLLLGGGWQAERADVDNERGPVSGAS